jgi:hypothetical protein
VGLCVYVTCCILAHSRLVVCVHAASLFRWLHAGVWGSSSVLSFARARSLGTVWTQSASSNDEGSCLVAFSGR